ncbi:MAG: DUF6600 domain-containing protein, partial [Syntrophomonadaceae bacterium]
MTPRRARRRWRRLALALLAGLASPLLAQQPPDDGAPPYDQQPAPYETANAGIDQTVARISYLNGNVSYSRGDDPDNWQDADVNVPMTIGDRVYTGEGSVELQLEGGALLDLGARTDVAALNLTDQVSQFAVKVGVGSFAVPRLSPGEIFEVDTPNSAVTFDQPGHYRVDVDESGQTRVIVRQGAATVAAGGGQLEVGAGEAIVIDGIDSPRYEVVGTPPPDRWDSWAATRQDRELRAASVGYVSPGVVGAADLDAYGRWDTLPQYGRVWTPSSVPAGWAPYRDGHWTWQDPWGWTWISTEPWGWAPYHYGRWVTDGPRWYWVPVAPAVRSIAYAPALVAFVGSPVGIGVSISAGPAFVGWFPLAPRDPLVPWWGARAREVNVTQVTNVTYVNRTYVTVVNQQTFVSGGLVAPAVVRETSTMRQIAAAPVVVGRVPVAPTVASMRVSVRPNAAPASRPPAAVVQRAVVTRAAPPPAPPRFDQKLAMIRENKAPVAPQAAARIAPNAARQVVASRPVASEQGNVRLAPKQTTGGAPGKRVVPVTASTAAGQRVAPAPAVPPREVQGAPTPVPARPGAEPRPGAETRAGTEGRVPPPAAEPSTQRPPLRPTAPPSVRRPDEPSLAPPAAERNPERPSSQSEREIVRPTPPGMRPPSPNPNAANPNRREMPPEAAPRNESAPPASRSEQVRPTPRRGSPQAEPPPPRGAVRPTPSARVNPERQAAPP